MQTCFLPSRTFYYFIQLILIFFYNLKDANKVYLKVLKHLNFFRKKGMKKLLNVAGWPISPSFPAACLRLGVELA